MPASIEIRNLSQRDLPAAAAIHALAFPDSALTALGAEAMRRYYEWQLNGPHDVSAFGAFHNNELVGYCFSGVFRGALSGFLRRNRAYLAWRVMTHPWLIANPLFRDRLMNGLRVLRRFSKPREASNTKPRQKKPSFGILAIAVNPGLQGKGAGRLLMAESEAVAREKGFEEMSLTVNTENHQAIKFYEALGWRKVTQDNFQAGGMIKELSKRPPGDGLNNG